MVSKSNEWYTPSRYIEAARAVMGDIDLDPASCALANETVKARWYHTQKDNGLAQEWWGRVWLNPPYGRLQPEKTGSTISYQVLFTRKLLQEYSNGNIEQAIVMLLGNGCFSTWFQSLWSYPVCFHLGRIDFERVDGTKSHFGFGTIFAYLGPNEQRFIDTFSQFGTIAKRVSQPHYTAATPSLWEVAV